MSSLNGKLHCPHCGGTDPADWRESAGTPTWCLEDTAEITEECGIGCDHLDPGEANRYEALRWGLPPAQPRGWGYPVGGVLPHLAGAAIREAADRQMTEAMEAVLYPKPETTRNWRIPGMEEIMRVVEEQKARNPSPFVTPLSDLIAKSGPMFWTPAYTPPPAPPGNFISSFTSGY